jgi:RNA polymerase sigma factor (sigma-70 family)
MPATDVALLELWIAARDGEAFNELVSRHAGLVHGACRRVLGNVDDAQDVAQDCFLKLARVSSPPVEPRQSLAAWLHAVATRAAIDLLRIRSRRRRHERRAAELRGTASGPEPWRLAFSKQARLDRDGAAEVRGLPPGKQRIAFHAVRREGGNLRFGELLGVLAEEVAPGEVREVALDLEEFSRRFGGITASVRGAVDPKRVFLRLHSVADPEESWTMGSTRLDARGRARFGGLLPGKYVITVNDYSEPPVVSFHSDPASGSLVRIKFHAVLESPKVSGT